MAQGRQERFRDLGYPKCRIKVLGEELLQRTCRLVSPRAGIQIVGRDELRAEGFRLITLQNPGNCILDGLADLWSCGIPEPYPEPASRITVLFGDVFYTEDAVERIFSDVRPLVFSGTSDISPSTGELFSLSFDRGTADAVLSAVIHIPCRQIPSDAFQPGHLRNLLWHFQRGPRAARLKWVADYFLPIDDGTTDFDEPSDLKKIAKLEALHARRTER